MPWRGAARRAREFPLLTSLRSLALSPTHRAAAIYAFTGLGFSGANLVLAKVLPPREYALLALLVSVLSVAVPVAPLGADGIFNRRLLWPTSRLLARACATSLAVACVAALGGRAIYDFSAPITLVLFAGVVAGGVMMVAAAGFQRFQRFGFALMIEQGGNFILIGASLLMLVPAFQSLWFPIALMAGGYVGMALLGWSALFRRHPRPAREADDPGFPWGEALTYAGVSAAGLLMLQAERLLIPRVLALEDLATFGVLAAVVIAPFRTLQMGASFSLLPRLRAAEDARARRRLLRREALGLGLAVVIGSLLLIALAPWVFEWLFGDKFPITPDLILAAVVAGNARVLSGIAKGTAAALCSAAQLRWLNLLTWLTTGAAFAAGTVGAGWGLVGLIYGFALGWLTLAAVCAFQARSHLRVADPSRR